MSYSIICDRYRSDSTLLTKLTYVVSSSVASNARVDVEPYIRHDCYIYGTSNHSDGASSSRVSVAAVAVGKDYVLWAINTSTVNKHLYCK